MLIEFSVANYRSIYERQTLSMSAVKSLKEMWADNTFALSSDPKSAHLLRSCAIYGPNASGKTSLVMALKFMKQALIDSAKESQAGEAIDITSFKLSPTARTGDSEFQIIFIENGIRFQYGFSCNQVRFTEEWLYACPTGGRQQKWFHRVTNPETQKDEFKFSAHFFGGQRREIWAKETRPNALYLSTALQKNNEQLTPVLKWFREKLHIISGRFESNFTLLQSLSEDFKGRVLSFLQAADLSIADLNIQHVPLSLDALPRKLPADIKVQIIQDIKDKDAKFLQHSFLHKDTETGELISFDSEEESAGTNALFNFAGTWLDVLENENVLIVDELESSLHPLIVHQIIKMLHQQSGKAQLIFTTHDTSILSQRILRRDQVWFMEKDQQQSTRLYSLSDFSPREKEALENGYLHGRYGGIPILSSGEFYGKRCFISQTQSCRSQAGAASR